MTPNLLNSDEPCQSYDFFGIINDPPKKIKGRGSLVQGHILIYSLVKAGNILVFDVFIDVENDETKIITVWMPIWHHKSVHQSWKKKLKRVST